MTRLERIVISPGCVVGLAILLANDLLLKRTFHNFATGKLSDIAGIWLVTLFATAVPRLGPRIAPFLIGLTFVIWKTPFVQPAIDVWNRSSLPTIWREADLTDLAALIVMPLAVRYAAQRPDIESKAPFFWRFACTAALSVVALFSFAATQRVGDHVCCGGAFEAPFGKGEFLSRLTKAGARGMSRTPELSDDRGDWYGFAMPEPMCGERVHVNVRLTETDGRTVITIQYILYNCSKENDGAVQERFDSFMKRVLSPA